MTNEQRSRASVDMTLTFFNSYYSSWRLSKVLSIKKILDNRYEFYSEFIKDVKNVRDEIGEATIAQEIKNGLFFDSISECVQYVEDLFALIKASEKPDFFVRSIISYSAGDLGKYIKRFVVSNDTLSKAFHFPIDYKIPNEEDLREFENAVSVLSNMTTDLIKFYLDYKHTYNQYKHGLTVGMRTFGNVFVEDQINQDKQGKFPPYLAVYDNLNLDEASKKGRFDPTQGILMPGFTDNVREILGDLIKENNFLRLSHIQNTNIDIDYLVDVAYKARACIQLFIYNYSWKIKPEENTIKFQLPTDHRGNTYIDMSLFTESI
jgi:hypothetical protein